MAKIDPELNRARVRKAQEKVDRFSVTLPKGTSKRIADLGFQKSAFIRETILGEIERLEKMKK